VNGGKRGLLNYEKSADEGTWTISLFAVSTHSFPFRWETSLVPLPAFRFLLPAFSAPFLRSLSFCSAPLCSHLFIRALIAMFIASYSLWQWSNVRSLLQTRVPCVCPFDTFDNPINIYEALYWNNTELLYGRCMYACPSIRV